MNQTEAVKQQYTDDQNLALRIQFHATYSVNKQGLVPWLFEQYRFKAHDSILELGCGNAAQWQGKRLPQSCKLILSDFSEGMVRAAKEKLSPAEDHVDFQIIDIQDIPFEDTTFDAVIANFMLYHVPDLAKALAEVRRVLKPSGTFYAATNGANGLHAFVREALRHCNPRTDCFSRPFSFKLHNGGELLSGYFSSVKRVDYIDSLAVTNTQDLIDWARSTSSVTGYTNPDQLYDYFEAIRLRDGAINIPKEVGMFVCIK